MAKINRATQKIFGSNANSTAITEFGTAKNAEPTYITDGNVEDIQANPSFLTGWSNSLEQDLAPFMQDSNALWYMITSQMAYLMQQGIPEYDAGSEYPTGALCKVINNGTVILYKALQDMLGDNIGHNPNVNDGVYWTIYSSDDNLAKYEIGLPQPSLSNTKKDNEVWLDGTEGTNGIVAISQYRNLYNIWGTRYGGDGVTTFGLPNMTGKYLCGVNSLDNTADSAYIEAGDATVTIPVTGWGTTGSAPGKITKGRLIVGSGATEKSEVLESLRAAGLTQTLSVTGANEPPAIKVRWKTRYY